MGEMSTSLRSCLQVVYFESQPFVASLHAMRRSSFGGRLFTIAHGFLAVACVFVGAALKISLLHVLEPNSSSTVWLLGGSLCACMALILIIRISHRGWRSELGMLRASDPQVRLQRCKVRVAMAHSLAAHRRRHDRSHRHRGRQVEPSSSTASASALSPTGSSITSPTPLLTQSASVTSQERRPGEHHAASVESDTSAHKSAFAVATATAGAPSLPEGPVTEVALDAMQGSAAYTAARHAVCSELKQSSRLQRVAARLQVDQALRRRILWLLRAVVCGMVIGWTAIVDSSSAVSPLGFTGGLCVLCVMLHGLDYPDIVNYSDEVAGAKP